MQTLALIGRPNTGKSTLFNRLVGKDFALVEASPNMTRDRRQGKARLLDLTFQLIDTAGLDEAHQNAFQNKKNVLQSKKNVLQSKENALRDKNNISQDKKNIFQNKKNALRDKKNIPQDKKNLPRNNEDVFQNKKNALRDKKNIPQDKKNVPRNNEDVFQDRKNLPRNNTNPLQDKTNPFQDKNNVLQENKNPLQDKKNVLQDNINIQTKKAMAQADVILFLIDIQEGILPYDRDLAQLLHKQGKPVLLLANKCERKQDEEHLLDVYELGFADVVGISALHGTGKLALYNALCNLLAQSFDEERSLKGEGQERLPKRKVREGEHQEQYQEKYQEKYQEQYQGKYQKQHQQQHHQEQSHKKGADSQPTHKNKKPISIAILGRPNAGKSSLINQLLGEERLVVSDIEGTTRDAIDIGWRFKGQTLTLWDTAGIRRKKAKQTYAETLSVKDALRAVQFCDVLVLVADGASLANSFEKSLESQDLHLAALAAKEGRAVILLLNKTDLLKEMNKNDLEKMQREVERNCARALPQLAGLKPLWVSAKTKEGLGQLMPYLLGQYKKWTSRIATSQLNKWLAYVVEKNPPPNDKGRAVRLRYMTQAKARPPSFVVFSQRGDKIPESYQRFLLNELRKSFKLDGLPLRLFVRKRKNPFG